MIKFYRPAAEQLLLLAIHTKEYLGESLLSVAERLRHHNPPRKLEGQIFIAARKGVNNFHSVDNNLDTLITAIYAQLAADTTGRGDRDLIDLLVSTLQLPYARNVLAGEGLRRLKQAILLPSELGGLQQRLRLREMSCANCGAAFHNGESVIINGGADGPVALLCYRCGPVQSVACSSCHHVVPLSAKAVTSMKRMQCETCQAAKMPAIKPVLMQEDALPAATPRGFAGHNIQNGDVLADGAAIPPRWPSAATLTPTLLSEREE